MAGQGSRFFEEKYHVPKPFVPVRGRPMFLTSAASFPPADHTIFLVQAQHLEKYRVAELVEAAERPDVSGVEAQFPKEKGLFSHTIVPVHTATEGQACTCLLAEDHLPRQARLFIASCDYEMVYDREAYEALAADPDVDVIIWTFKIGAVKKANPNAFAYCRTDGGRVVEVVEKRTISSTPENDPAVVGSFSYRTADLFIRGVRQMVAKNIRVNNEFYVGTSINQLIEAGCNVVTFPIEKFISFGNPYELMHFEYWEAYFDALPDHPYTMNYGHKRLPK
jgi:dTDP-glucose pyrophosphorylase